MYPEPASFARRSLGIADKEAAALLVAPRLFATAACDLELPPLAAAGIPRLREACTREGAAPDSPVLGAAPIS